MQNIRMTCMKCSYLLLSLTFFATIPIFIVVDAEFLKENLSSGSGENNVPLEKATISGIKSSSSTPRLPRSFEDMPSSDSDDVVLTVKHKEFSDEFITGLVAEGQIRAEKLFGVLIADSEPAADLGESSFTKRSFPNTTLIPSTFPTLDNTSSADRLGRFGAVMIRVIPVSQQANVLLDVTKGVSRDKRAHIQNVGDLTGLSVPQFRAICPVPKDKAAVRLSHPFDGDALPFCAKQMYRTMNGFCNNIAFHSRGKESTIYRRLLPSSYADGISEARLSVTSAALPGARLVSLTVFDNAEGPGRDMSAMSVHFGQFLAHEIASSPSSKSADNKTPKCCDVGTLTTHPDCWPIEIPVTDHFSIAHGRSCMEFVRTLPGVRPGCTLGPREQVNQVTHYIDASGVYGSTDEESLNLRAFQSGLLKTTTPYWNAPHFTLLPTDPTGCTDSSGLKCFKGGDKRTNVQPGLTLLHTLWMRQHNRVAQNLATVNPHWSDEKLFQEARRIVIAQVQHIVYNEYITSLLGPAVIESFGLTLLKDGMFTDYNISSNPTITSEFATAAFRLHSTIPPILALRNADNSQAGSKPLRESWFSPFDLYNAPYFTQCAAGMAAGAWDKMDHHFTKETQNHLFQTFPNLIGLDLPAVDIQRGRDHGVQPYVKYRALCQLKVPKSFQDLKTMGIMPETVVDRMASIYSSVEDLDLFVGGTVEKHVAGGKVGPTFACIIGEQFYQLRTGDRFWYENGLPLPSVLSSAQLHEIRRTTFAQILCSNVEGLENIQPRLFHAPDRHENLRIPCSSLVDIDLAAWKE